VAKVQCLQCLVISEPSNPGATTWDCACGNSYALRRCSSCGVTSNVRSLQRQGAPWNCNWCKAANTGYSRRGDPAAATLTDLSADMARQGLSFASRPPQGQAPRDTQPEIGGMSEVAAYGTAVTVEPLQSADPADVVDRQ
jgi:hypothetical protein